MSLHISFELSQSDLDHFREVMQRAVGTAEGSSRQEIIENAKHLLEQINRSDATDLIRDSMSQLEALIGMVMGRWEPTTINMSNSTIQPLLTSISAVGGSTISLRADLLLAA